MKSVKVLDVTLRDGGCVIDFNFGKTYMDQILSGLERSGVDIIELGYLDKKNGSESGRTQFCDEQVITNILLKNKKKDTTYVAMFDFGKFDPEHLHQNSGNGIDGIRIAFHKKDRYEAIQSAKTVLKKGYQIYIQPMVIMRYSEKEIVDLVQLVNSELPDASAFYVVDSFGEMRNSDMERIIHLVDRHLSSHIPIGFHSHNNLQLSYSNAVSLLDYPIDRELLIDGAILGMGKGAGNLSTELFLEHLNLFYGKHYSMFPLLEVIDKVLSTLRAEYYWGYSIEYYLSSLNHCTPSYASHFYKKHMLPVEKVAELLGLISEEKKLSFDKEYADRLYLNYNARCHQDDDPVIRRLTELIGGRKALLIAPGKSITEAQDIIAKTIKLQDVITISLNHYALFETDYVLITRSDILYDALGKEKRIITTSAVLDIETNTEDMLVIDYKKWITIENGIQDSSGVIALKLMAACGASEIILAGFDGFSVDINKNYYEKAMRHPVTEEQALERNKYFKEYVKRMQSTIPVRFLTHSLYEDIT